VLAFPWTQSFSLIENGILSQFESYYSYNIMFLNCSWQKVAKFKKKKMLAHFHIDKFNC